MDKQEAEKIFNDLLKDCKKSTIYNSDLDEETIKFYQKYPEVFLQTKGEIIEDFISKKEQIINDIMTE